MKKINIFDFINDISWNKENILCEENEKIYNVYMINKFLSMNRETIFYINAINKYDKLDKKTHYSFLMNVLKKKKRFFKYLKKDKIDDLKYIMEYYNVSERIGYDYLKLLNQDQINIIKDKLKHLKL